MLVEALKPVRYLDVNLGTQKENAEKREKKC